MRAMGLPPHATALLFVQPQVRIIHFMALPSQMHEGNGLLIELHLYFRMLFTYIVLHLNLR